MRSRAALAPVGVILLMLLIMAPSAWAGHPRADGPSLAASPADAEINVSGSPTRGSTSYTEVSGILEGHLHWMGFEFLGGSVHCGRPWHPGGVAQALKDCPDHAGNGTGAVLENIISTGSPIGSHDNGGWPTFKGWPRPESLTHEMTYHRWVERMWRGGLRVMSALLVDNEVLCQLYPLKRNSCNEMASVRLQARRIRELETYVDNLHGGPGKGWFRIVGSPFEAREVANQGKLAVVLGIEVSKLFDCDVQNDVPQCDRAQIDRQLAEVHRMGVRDLELVNKFDNALSGVTFDSGALGPPVNAANAYQTGKFWQIQTCRGPTSDKTQITSAPSDGRDELLGKGLGYFLPAGAVPVYPPPPHCNVKGLTDLGTHLIRRMMERKMIVDIDHMSAVGRDQAMSLLESQRYSGVFSSHSWADDPTWKRIVQLGGVVTPSDGRADEFAKDVRKVRSYRNPRHFLGVGVGSDLNGFSSAPGRRDGSAVTYPFRSLDGKQVIDRQRSGSRVFDVNRDGTAHYGLYLDWLEDVRKAGGNDVATDLRRGAEAYLQMWERAEGVPSQRCRSPHVHFSRRGLDRVRMGASPRSVLFSAGQPARRNGRVFRWCVGRRLNSRAKTLAVFTRAGKVGLIATNGRGHAANRSGPSGRVRRIRGRVRRVGRTLLVRRARGGVRVVYGVRRGRIRFVALASRGVAKNRRTLRNYLRLSGIR